MYYHCHRDGVHESIWELGLLQYLKLACYRARVVTIILYLNDSLVWEEENHGGCLRIYDGTDIKDDYGSTCNEVVNISPLGGRLVLFDSQRILHEVIPTFKDRFAVTIWITEQ
jgi:SM-20-related protein